LLTDSGGGNSNQVERLYAIDPRNEPSAGNQYAVTKLFTAPASWWPTGQSFYVNAEAYDSTFAVASGLDPHGRGVVMVWGTSSAKPVIELPFTDGHAGGAGQAPYDIVTDVVLLPVRNELAAYNDRLGEFAVWSTQTWQRVATISVGDLGGIAPVKGGSLLVSARVDSRGGIVETNLDTKTTSVLVPSGRYARVEGSPTSSVLAATSVDDSSLNYFSSDGHLIAAVHLAGIPVNFAWQPGTGRIAVALADGSVETIDSTMRPDGPLLRGNQSDGATTVAWDPVGGLLAVGTLRRNNSMVYAGPVAFWDTEPDWTRTMCVLGGGGLTKQDWKTYVGTAASYASLC
jgi:hypothetical protein